MGWIVLDEHDSPQWYDIVHFEYKALLWASQKASFQWTFPKLAEYIFKHKQPLLNNESWLGGSSFVLKYIIFEYWKDEER